MQLSSAARERLKMMEMCKEKVQKSSVYFVHVQLEETSTGKAVSCVDIGNIVNNSLLLASCYAVFC